MQISIKRLLTPKDVGGVMVRVLALRGLPLKKAHKDINFAYGQIYEKF